MSSRNGNKRQLVELQDALFGKIDRLSDPDISEDKLKLEVARTKALTDVASRICSRDRRTMPRSSITGGASRPAPERRRRMRPCAAAATGARTPAASARRATPAATR